MWTNVLSVCEHKIYSEFAKNTKKFRSDSQGTAFLDYKSVFFLDFQSLTHFLWLSSSLCALFVSLAISSPACTVQRFEWIIVWGIQKIFLAKAFAIRQKFAFDYLVSLFKLCLLLFNSKSVLRLFEWSLHPTLVHSISHSVLSSSQVAYNWSIEAAHFVADTSYLEIFTLSPNDVFLLYPFTTVQISHRLTHAVCSLKPKKTRKKRNRERIKQSFYINAV